ncbi:imidazolonepropionase [Desulfocicer vacuolatum DSM 3385]|uniref:Imidazolonepropionase n=1 Tax=Desulfocicer vacuolatum DSM 3385 TaxID=1121400 RepID=A0A1W2A6J6_9BACT|nr:imidazolonepropionase [Desulfocicer vacuolatum]SMC56359.1 imidazolonepropionase [Desulfocicer vacuolatum DSM 3385]
MNGNLIVKNAAQVVTCSGFKAKQGPEMSDLSIIDNGAVIIEAGKIKAVGDSFDLLKGFDTREFEVIDATRKAVLPGFVDSHTHFVFGGYRPDEFAWRLRGDSYMDIMNRGGGIANSVQATRNASPEELMQVGQKRLDSMLSFGVTTVEGKSGYGLDLGTEIKQLKVMKELGKIHPMDIIPTFLGAHATPPEFKGRTDQFIDLVMEMLPEIEKQQLAEFCDIFCEKNVFSVEQSRKLLSRAKELGFKLKIHADEIVQFGGAELAAELGAVSADHLLQASDQGIKDMAGSGVVTTLLPGTAFSLKEPYARGRYMIDNGCAVALATDLNPGSCFSESIPLIVALATLYMHLTPEEAITALTINGAAAVDRADRIGSIDKGKQGDLVILEFPSYRFIPYHVGVNTVETVIKKGDVVFSRNL